MAEVVLRDRRLLASYGVAIVSVVVDDAGRPAGDVDVLTRGVIHEDASQELLDDACEAVFEALRTARYVPGATGRPGPRGGGSPGPQALLRAARRQEAALLRARPPGERVKPAQLGPLALVLIACGSPPAPADVRTVSLPACGAVVGTMLEVSGADGGEADPSPPGREPTPEELAALQGLEGRAAELRGLEFVRPVTYRIQTRVEITTFVEGQIDAADVEVGRIRYAALGLSAPDADIRDLLVRVFGEQIVGYYDPEGGFLVVRDDVAAGLGLGGLSLGETEMIIVHELVHALQDQVLGLGERYEQERTVDADNALSSLVEGDASLAMLGHMAAANGGSLQQLTANARVFDLLLSQNAAAAAGQDSELDSAPAILRETLLSRYLDGMRLSARLHGVGGWALVNDAHERPPLSTEQVLHPERYLEGDDPEDIALPALPELEAAGLRVVDEDTLGELELSIYFGLGLDASRDRAGGEGWGGDRLRVYLSRDGRASAVWLVSFDSELEATEGAAAAAERASEERRHCGVVRRDGRHVLIVRGLDPALHPAAGRALDAVATARENSRAFAGNPRRHASLTG